MKPVMQTRVGRPLGNCWAACIASILELPVASVDWSEHMTAEEIEPHGIADGDVADEWTERRVFRLRLLGYAELILGPDTTVPAACHYIALGVNSAGPHACVYYERLPVHDPNPAQLGLERIDYVVFLVHR